MDTYHGYAAPAQHNEPLQDAGFLQLVPDIPPITCGDCQRRLAPGARTCPACGWEPARPGQGAPLSRPAGGAVRLGVRSAGGRRHRKGYVLLAWRSYRTTCPTDAGRLYPSAHGPAMPT